MNKYMLPIGLAVVVTLGGYVYMQGHKSLPQASFSSDPRNEHVEWKNAVCKINTIDDYISISKAFVSATGRPSPGGGESGMASILASSKEEQDKFIFNVKSQEGCFTL